MEFKELEFASVIDNIHETKNRIWKEDFYLTK